MQDETPFANADVANAYADFDEPVRSKLLEIRELVIQTAQETEYVIGFGEALKWGEPSFVTESGSTVRINQTGPDDYALYFNCQSKLVETFRALFPATFRYEGNRAILFSADDTLPTNELRLCISLALTYHKRKHRELLGA